MTKKRLIQVFAAAFPGSEADLEKLPDGRFSGELLWDGFAGKSHAQRQRTLARVVGDAFDEAEQLRVAAILTFTPDEVAVMQGR